MFKSQCVTCVKPFIHTHLTNFAAFFLNNLRFLLRDDTEAVRASRANKSELVDYCFPLVIDVRARRLDLLFDLINGGQ